MPSACRQLALVAALSITLIGQACGGKVIKSLDGECPTSGSVYTVQFKDVTGGGTLATSKGLLADDFTGAWSQETGILYLGTDEVVEPLGTLTITLSGHPAGPGSATVESAIVSTTDVRVGTSDELNARLYELVPGATQTAVLRYSNSQCLGGTLTLKLRRVIIYPDQQQPESVTAIVDFFVRLD
ncbi:MAG: hypothetical protein KC609_05450 [Myxococcales bacterium]|nr:hypothetical protein [Myxococcales bacterium]